MSITLPDITKQSTTESNDYFLLHNTNSNRTRTISYGDLKNELTADIDHVTAAQLASAITTLNASITLGDDSSYSATLAAATPSSFLATLDYVAGTDILGNPARITYNNLRNQINSEIVAPQIATLTSNLTSIEAGYKVADTVLVQNKIPTLAITNGIVNLTNGYAVITDKDNIAKRTPLTEVMNYLSDYTLHGYNGLATLGNLTDTQNVLINVMDGKDNVVVQNKIPTLLQWDSTAHTLITSHKIVVTDEYDTAKRLPMLTFLEFLDVNRGFAKDSDLTNLSNTLSALIDTKINTALTNKIFPVGSRISRTGSLAGTNPATYLGFGTWVEERGCFYASRGYNTSVSTPSTIDDMSSIHAQHGSTYHYHTAQNVSLTTAQIPSHTHGFDDYFYPEAFGFLPDRPSLGLQTFPNPDSIGWVGSSGSDGDNTGVRAYFHNTYPAGSGSPHTHAIDNTYLLPPCKIEVVWRRVA